MALFDNLTRGVSSFARSKGNKFDSERQGPSFKSMFGGERKSQPSGGMMSRIGQIGSSMMNRRPMGLGGTDSLPGVPVPGIGGTASLDAPRMPQMSSMLPRFGIPGMFNNPRQMAPTPSLAQGSPSPIRLNVGPSENAMSQFGFNPAMLSGMFGGRKTMPVKTGTPRLGMSRRRMVNG